MKLDHTWKIWLRTIQLTSAISCMSSKGASEEHLTHLKGVNIEIMINDKADEVTEEFCE